MSLIFICRKNENAVFPEHLKKSLSNLVRFVLRYSSQSVKLQTSLEICSKSCLTSNLEYSIERLRTLAADIRHLKLKLLRVEERLAEQASDATSQDTHLREKIAKLLSLVLSHKHFEEKNTRAMYNSLKKSYGNSISRQKVLNILREHSIFQAQFKSFLEQSIKYFNVT